MKLGFTISLFTILLLVGMQEATEDICCKCLRSAEKIYDCPSIVGDACCDGLAECELLRKDVCPYCDGACS